MEKSTLLYIIKPEQQNKESLLQILSDHKEIQYVSLMGVDLAGNDTDEKIPINIFLHDLDKFLYGSAAQTDGSSVVLPGIATLNDARVDMTVDATSTGTWITTMNTWTKARGKLSARCACRVSLSITIPLSIPVLS